LVAFEELIDLAMNTEKLGAIKFFLAFNEILQELQLQLLSNFLVFHLLHESLPVFLLPKQVHHHYQYYALNHLLLEGLNYLPELPFH
jgi:hypothetical protein